MRPNPFKHKAHRQSYGTVLRIYRELHNNRFTKDGSCNY